MPFDTPLHTSESSLDRVLNAGLPVLLVFWRRDCPPCDQLAPVLDRLARSYARRVLIVKVDAGDETGLVRRYNILSLPSLLFIKDGSPLATAIGAGGEHELAAWLEYLSAGGSRPPVPSGPSIPLQSVRDGGASTSRGGTPPPGAQRAATQSAGGSQPGGQRVSSAGGEERPLVLTDATFDETIRNSRVPVLVDFWAVWCGPCRMVAPTVEEMSREFAGRALIAKLNVDENPRVTNRYGVMSIPSLLIFRNGQVVDQIVGAQPPQVLRQRLARQVPA